MTQEQIRVSPSDRYYSRNVFELPGYEARYDLLMDVMQDYLVTDHLKGAHVVDIACGSGGMGARFQEHGANVTFIDGRESNLAAVRERTQGSKTVLYNMESAAPFPVERADISLCMGLIYHTGDPLAVLKKAGAFADIMFVETSCMDHDGVALIFYQESPEPSQFSVTGNACRPSPKWVEQALGQCGFNTILDISCGRANLSPGEGYPGTYYDWKFERTCGWRRDERALKKLYLALRGKSDLVRRI